MPFKNKIYSNRSVGIYICSNDPNIRTAYIVHEADCLFFSLSHCFINLKNNSAAKAAAMLTTVYRFDCCCCCCYRCHQFHCSNLFYRALYIEQHFSCPHSLAQRQQFRFSAHNMDMDACAMCTRVNRLALTNCMWVMVSTAEHVVIYV